MTTTDQNLSDRIDWRAFKAVVDRHERFLLTSHVRPDCDALGSEMALWGLLRGLGKHVRIVNADPVPPRLAFVDPALRIEVLHREVRPEDLGQVEVIIVVDTGSWAQLGGMADVIRASAAQLVVIDHHVGDEELTALFFRDDRAEATGRLVADLVDALGLPVTREMAQSLYVAIATDTGWFRFPSTRSSTYQVAARLMDAGACPHEIFRRLYECDSLSRARLRGVALSHLVIEPGGRLAHTFLRTEDFAGTGALSSDTEDFINMALAIEGTKVAVMLVEQPDGRFKVSLRSRGLVDCSRVAAMFDGGGHVAAAGATVRGTFEEVQQRVLHAVRAAMVHAEA